MFKVTGHEIYFDGELVAIIHADVGPTKVNELTTILHEWEESEEPEKCSLCGHKVDGT